MQKEQNMVLDFHRKYNMPRGMLQNAIFSREAWLDVGIQRDRLISEEHLELKTAWHRQDITEIADALGDLAYVVLGTAVAAGIDIEPLLHEIHRSNMTKDIGEFKPKKGPMYEHPQIRPLLIAQGFTIKQL